MLSCKVTVQLPFYVFRYPRVPRMPQNWFFANVHLQDGSYNRLPVPIFVPNKYINYDFKKLHEYHIRDRNMHPNIVGHTEDGCYILGGKVTHDDTNRILEEKNVLLGPIGKDSQDSYFNAHAEYVLDSKLSKVVEIRELIGKKSELTAEQLKIINDAMHNYEKSVFTLEYLEKYSGRGNLSGVAPKSIKPSKTINQKNSTVLQKQNEALVKNLQNNKSDNNLNNNDKTEVD